MAFDRIVKKVINWFNNKTSTQKEMSSKEVSKKIIRCVIKYNEDRSFRPTTYVELVTQKDLFKDQDEFAFVKKRAEECCREVDEDHVVKEYIIFEMPFDLPQDICMMETYFSLLNSHLNIMPEQCYIIDIFDIIKDPSVSNDIKAVLLNTNCGVKIFRCIDLDSTKPHIDYEIVSTDMRITDSGAVEKYCIKFHNKYDLVIYRVCV